MLVGFAEGLGAAKTYAARHHYEIDANSELLGLGCRQPRIRVVRAAWSSTAASRKRRSTGRPARSSQMSGLVVAVLTIVTLLFLTGLFEDLPEATLAAVVIAAVVELVDFAALRDFYRLYTVRLGRIYGTAARPDFIAAVAAMLGVLLFDTLPGLIIGIVVSLVLLIYRASTSTHRRARSGRRGPGPILRPRAPPRQRRSSRHPHPARRGRPVLRQRRRRADCDQGTRGRTRHTRRHHRRRGDRLHRHHSRPHARGARQQPGKCRRAAGHGPRPRPGQRHARHRTRRDATCRCTARSTTPSPRSAGRARPTRGDASGHRVRRPGSRGCRWSCPGCWRSGRRRGSAGSTTRDTGRSRRA